MSLSVFLGAEEEESAEDPEDEIREESECGEVNIELPVVCPDGKDLEDGENANAEYVDWTHIEVVPFIDLAKLAGRGALVGRVCSAAWPGTDPCISRG